MRTAIDLFAGAGGLSEGLAQAGFDVLFANEISPAHSVTHKQNHPTTEVCTNDIRQINPSTIRRQLGLARGELDLVAGGPPCQGFSVNAPVRSTDDDRNHLFLDFLKFVEEMNPKAVLIENVPGMVSFEKGATLAAIIRSLRELGYKCDVRVLYAPHYGVPQMRWRTIFLANRVQLDPVSMFPMPSFSAQGRANFTTKFQGSSLIVDQRTLRGLQPFVTVADAISDLPEIGNGGGEQVADYERDPTTNFQTARRIGASKLVNHACAGLGRANLARLPFIPQGGSWRDIPHELLPEGMKRARKSDHTKRYGRLAWDGIASTILTKCDPHWGSYLHPTQDRVISVREAARFQTFPDTFQFFGSLSDQYEQVGNAVPPLLARALGKSILASINGNPESSVAASFLETQIALEV